MKKAYQNVSLIDLDNEVVGINLGFDFTAEHEWGIEGLSHLLGVDNSKSGLTRFKVSKLNNIHTKAENDLFYIYTDYYNIGFERLQRNYQLNSNQDLGAWWDSKNFLIIARGDTANKLEFFYKHLYSKTVLLHLRREAFGINGSGLKLLAVDTSTPFWQEQDSILKEAEATLRKRKTQWARETKGLYEALLAMGKTLSSNPYSQCPWIYLPLEKPDGSWTFEPKYIIRNGTMKVWLNPSHQHLFSFGYWSSEELWQWARGDGPIWPLLVAMPPEHPIYEYIHSLVPAPDSSIDGTWGSYPWNKTKRYLNGEYFWTHAAEYCGLSLNTLYDDGSGGKIPTCKLFQNDLKKAEQNGLTEFFIVKNKQRFLNFIEDWNRTHGDNINYHLYGRGLIDTGTVPTDVVSDSAI